MRPDPVLPTIRLAEYAPPGHLVEDTALEIRLDPDATRVRARLKLRRNPAHAGPPPDLHLDGEDLTLRWARLDGEALPDDRLEKDGSGLRIAARHLPGARFVWEAETEIAPTANTALEGLYMSRGMYCTQCEAEGFRRITYYPDRPDVMAPFRVRLEADPDAAPVLLSNGNLVGSGPGWAEWHDPFPKPAYLFALVAGDLAAVEDRFVTASGREVLLQIWVRPGDEDRCGYAMDALKRSMRWDETEYGREYDLDRFMIVAVDDFNAGAMENKGLNIFNARYVLARSDTATDADYAGIESVIAHEYFHNWTGNRITCRDWFQLCLKEGLTVFRDQQFSADARSAPVKRIEDVLRLRAQQFPEDAGPLAHPVRPDSYVEINNFYTATVYEKGAEIIGMLRALVGPETWRAGCDLYFARHDGQACTVEDWIRVFEDVSRRDLSGVLRWYAQAGTPKVRVREDWDGTTYRLTLSQYTPPTPGQPEKSPVPIPLAYGLLGADGQSLAEGVLEFDTARAEYQWTLPERPTPSLLRRFSAPVILERDQSSADRVFLLAHDSDPFNRWEAARTEALNILAARAGNPQALLGPDYAEALRRLADDAGLDPAFRALALTLPSVEAAIDFVITSGGIPDPGEIHAARFALEREISLAMGDLPERLYATLETPGPYSPDAAAAGRRALRNRALSWLTARDPEAGAARDQAASADNMTDRMAALALLVRRGAADAALADFREDWAGDRLVMDKWFSVQAACAPPDDAVATVERLASDPDFNWKTPNRFRAVIGAFASANPAGFHHESGQGYDFVADWLLRLDPVNPQTAARLSAVFSRWRAFDQSRSQAMRTALERIAAAPQLSRDCAEMVGRLLRSDPDS